MSAIVISEELLAAAKNHLDITYEDEDTDSKLVDQLQRGISFVSSRTGVEKSSSVFAGDDVNLRAQELLWNYLLYDRAGSLDEFMKRYNSDTIHERSKWEVEQYLKRKQEAINETQSAG